MINRIRGKYQIAWAFSMIVLLALAACIPTAGSLLQQRHRTGRQNSLRREKNNVSAVQIKLSDALIANCFFAEEKELLFDGLRYDVIAVQNLEKYTVFTAIPDLKETQLCQLMAGNLLLPTLFTDYKASEQALLYLSNTFTNCPLYKTSTNARSVFFSPKVTVLTGFEWRFVPPPDEHGC